jgi:hypothetical protein
MYHPVFYQTAAYQKHQELTQAATRHRIARSKRTQRATRHLISLPAATRSWSNLLSSLREYIRKNVLTLDTNS